MPFIPNIRLGQTLHKPSLRRSHKTSASEHITNKTLDTKQRRERRLKQERRLKKIKVSFDQRRRDNRRKQNADADIEKLEKLEKLDNDDIGLHINTEA